MYQITRTICRQCHADCRLEVHSDDGQLMKIAEDRTDPRVDTNWPPQAPCKNACPAGLDRLSERAEKQYKKKIDANGGEDEPCSDVHHCGPTLLCLTTNEKMCTSVMERTS